MFLVQIKEVILVIRKQKLGIKILMCKDRDESKRLHWGFL